jgi:hypothetical protein
MQPVSYSRHRFPPELIRHAVWKVVLAVMFARRALHIHRDGLIRAMRHGGDAPLRHGQCKEWTMPLPPPNGTWCFDFQIHAACGGLAKHVATSLTWIICPRAGPPTRRRALLRE